MSIEITAPRIALAHLPTPLEPLDRLSEHLGGPRIWIKRDDCTGLATGGNKTRKLEFLLGDAMAKGCDTVITFGAVQSNHARQTAAACAKAGLACHLVLSRAVDRSDASYELTGNVQLDRMLGASIDIVEPRSAAAHAAALQTRLESQGHRVYTIPTGGSDTVGALGYVACAQELLNQTRDRGFLPNWIVHASSSGGTHAGLAVGLCHSTAQALGIGVSDPDTTAAEARIGNLATATHSRWAQDAPKPRINMRHDFLGEAYGEPTTAALDAIRTTARLEGILMDPVYSGKALAALFHMVRNRELDAGNPVVFVHTGGTAALPAYADVL